jgi:hypothetical protein
MLARPRLSPGGSRRGSDVSALQLLTARSPTSVTVVLPLLVRLGDVSAGRLPTARSASSINTFDSYTSMFDSYMVCHS